MSAHRDKAVEALRDAWLVGFAATGEGYNGEYPFDGNVAEDDELKAEATEYAQAGDQDLERMYFERAGRKAVRNLVDGWAEGELCPPAQDAADAIARKAVERFKEAVLSKEAIRQAAEAETYADEDGLWEIGPDAAEEALKAALSKAQQLMEEGG